MHLPPGICRGASFYAVYKTNSCSQIASRQFWGLNVVGFRYSGSLVMSGSGGIFVSFAFVGPMALSAVGSYGGVGGCVMWTFLRQGVSFTHFVVNSSASVTAFGTRSAGDVSFWFKTWRPYGC